MKKYKFKVNQQVYIINDLTVKNDYQLCIIRKRTIIDEICYYQLSKVERWQFNSTEKFSTIKFEKEIFDIGFRNFPRTDNWLQESYILDSYTEEDIFICSKNGCELVDSFLEKTEKELLDESITEIKEEINKKENAIDVITDIREQLLLELQLLYDKLNISISKLGNENNIYKFLENEEVIYGYRDDYKKI